MIRGSANESVPWRLGRRAGKAQMGAQKWWAGGSSWICIVQQLSRCSTSGCLQTFGCCNHSVDQWKAVFVKLQWGIQEHQGDWCFTIPLTLVIGGVGVVTFVKATKREPVALSCVHRHVIVPTGRHLVSGDHGDRDGGWRTTLFQWFSSPGNEETPWQPSSQTEKLPQGEHIGKTCKPDHYHGETHIPAVPCKAGCESGHARTCFLGIFFGSGSSVDASCCWQLVAVLGNSPNNLRLLGHKPDGANQSCFRWSQYLVSCSSSKSKQETHCSWEFPAQQLSGMQRLHYGQSKKAQYRQQLMKDAAGALKISSSSWFLMKNYQWHKKYSDYFLVLT